LVSELAGLDDWSHRSLQLAVAAARTADENRGRDIVVLDLRKLTSVFDYFVIATGTSRRQLHAMSEEIDRTLQEELHDERLGIEGYAESRWILLDYGSVVIHIFDEPTRKYFALEELWAEASRIDWHSVQTRSARSASEGEPTLRRNGP
jgi:ribosome-associated protein